MNELDDSFIAKRMVQLDQNPPKDLDYPAEVSIMGGREFDWRQPGRIRKLGSKLLNYLAKNAYLTGPVVPHPNSRAADALVSIQSKEPSISTQSLETLGTVIEIKRN